jgi:polyhydroxybutyrate depolymerase
VADSISTWVKLDGCKGIEKKEQNGIVTHSIYGECAAGVGVELYAVGSNGHNWPSQYVIPISQIIWEFFAAHPKP